MSIRLDGGAGERIAGRHDSAVTAIVDSADSVPGAPDGGIATGHLLDILAAVLGTADDIAVIQNVLARQVREATKQHGLTEEALADMFTDLNGELS